MRCTESCRYQAFLSRAYQMTELQVREWGRVPHADGRFISSSLTRYHDTNEGIFTFCVNPEKEIRVELPEMTLIIGVLKSPLLAWSRLFHPIGAFRFIKTRLPAYSYMFPAYIFRIVVQCYNMLLFVGIYEAESETLSITMIAVSRA
jgi:hypothetical protein